MLCFRRAISKGLSSRASHSYLHGGGGHGWKHKDGMDTVGPIRNPHNGHHPQRHIHRVQSCLIPPHNISRLLVRPRKLLDYEDKVARLFPNLVWTESVVPSYFIRVFISASLCSVFGVQCDGASCDYVSWVSAIWMSMARPDQIQIAQPSKLLRAVGRATHILLNDWWKLACIHFL